MVGSLLSKQGQTNDQCGGDLPLFASFTMAVLMPDLKKIHDIFCRSASVLQSGLQIS
jgi:hypothetical protein